MALPAQFDHPSWLTAVSTVVGYLVILTVMTILLFGVPYAFFAVM
jgi:hypothetical protein